MNRCWSALFLAGWLLAVTGCGGGDPGPKPLTPDEEKQFQQERQKARQNERGREG